LLAQNLSCGELLFAPPSSPLHFFEGWNSRWWESKIDLNQHEFGISPGGGVMGSGLIPRRSIADDIFFSGSMENIKLGSHRYLIADDILAKKKKLESASLARRPPPLA
jgi:hypothetical protein